MEFKDIVLPSDDEEIAQLEASLKTASGWKSKNERSLVWHSAIQEQNDQDHENQRERSKYLWQD